MSTITFDTLKFVTRLEQAGVSREQAAAIAEAQKEAFAEALDTNIATRAGLAEVKSELKADVTAMRAEMQAMEMRLTIKLGAFLTVAVGVIVTLLKH